MKNINITNNDIKILFFMPLVLPHGQPGVSDQIEFESENFAVFFLALKIYHWDLGQRRKWTNSSNFFPNWTKVFTQKKKKIFYWIRKIQPQKYCFVLQF